MERLLADGEDVKMEFHIVNHVYPEGKTSYNVVGEIPGTDKADEVVMLGGHLDSWHAATGATDNAIGSAVMMEAARLIQAMGLHGRPKNTYVREDQILPRLAAIAILLAGDAQARGSGTVQVTAAAQTAGLIDQLRASGAVLTYDPDTRTIRADGSNPVAVTTGPNR